MIFWVPDLVIPSVEDVKAGVSFGMNNADIGIAAIPPGLPTQIEVVPINWEPPKPIVVIGEVQKEVEEEVTPLMITGAKYVG